MGSLMICMFDTGLRIRQGFRPWCCHHLTPHPPLQASRPHLHMGVTAELAGTWAQEA